MLIDPKAALSVGSDLSPTNGREHQIKMFLSLYQHQRSAIDPTSPLERALARFGAAVTAKGH
jgi:hypothetical protein